MTPTRAALLLLSVAAALPVAEAAVPALVHAVGMAQHVVTEARFLGLYRRDCASEGLYAVQVDAGMRYASLTGVDRECGATFVSVAGCERSARGRITCVSETPGTYLRLILTELGELAYFRVSTAPPYYERVQGDLIRF